MISKVLLKKHESVGRELSDCKKKVLELKKIETTENLILINQSIDEVTKEEEYLNKEINSLSTKLGALNERINILGNKSLHAQLEESEIKCEMLKYKVSNKYRMIRAQVKLLDLFNQVQNYLYNFLQI